MTIDTSIQALSDILSQLQEILRPDAAWKDGITAEQKETIRAAARVLLGRAGELLTALAEGEDLPQEAIQELGELTARLATALAAIEEEEPVVGDEDGQGSLSPVIPPLVPRRPGPAPGPPWTSPPEDSDGWWGRGAAVPRPWRDGISTGVRPTPAPGGRIWTQTSDRTSAAGWSPGDYRNQAADSAHAHDLAESILSWSASSAP